MTKCTICKGKINIEYQKKIYTRNPLTHRYGNMHLDCYRIAINRLYKQPPIEPDKTDESEQS